MRHLSLCTGYGGIGMTLYDPYWERDIALARADAFHDDPFYDQREEERTTPAPSEPRPGSLEWAIDRGYDPADAAEGTY